MVRHARQRIGFAPGKSLSRLLQALSPEVHISSENCREDNVEQLLPENSHENRKFKYITDKEAVDSHGRIHPEGTLCFKHVLKFLYCEKRIHINIRGNLCNRPPPKKTYFILSNVFISL